MINDEHPTAYSHRRVGSGQMEVVSENMVIPSKPSHQNASAF